MQVLAKKSVLVKRIEGKDGKKVDLKTVKGQKIDLTEEDAVRIWGALDLSESEKKKLLDASKRNNYKRTI